MILGRRLLARAIQAIRVRVVKKWGGATEKARLWDSEFTSGKWAYLDHTIEDPIYHYLEKYSACGHILDLGCGSGNTGNELNEEAYNFYTGTDISAVAVQQAQLRSKENGRAERNEYICACIEKFAPKRKYNVILFRESIFYIPRSRITAVLNRYAAHLTLDGLFIVRMYDREKYRAIVELVVDHYHIVDTYLSVNEKSIILVFRPRSS